MAENTHIIYGIHAVQSALKQQASSISQVLVRSGKLNARLQGLVQVIEAEGVALQYLDARELDQLVGHDRHQGVVAYQREVGDTLYKEEDLMRMVADTEQPLLLVLDSVTDPHNLGACLRSADAAGVTAVIVPKDNSAPMNATVKKVAAGAAETVPLVRVVNLSRTLQQLQGGGVWITGTDDQATQTIYQADLTGPRAIVMGSEGKGIRRLVKTHCDELVSIPMAGEVSSLNVSVATGVCLFEAVRQRRSKLA